MNFRYTMASSGINGVAALQVNGYQLSPQISGGLSLPPSPVTLLKGNKVNTSDKRYGNAFLNSLAFAIQNVVLQEEPIQAAIGVGFAESRGQTTMGASPAALTLYQNGLSFLFVFNVGKTDADKAVLTPSRLAVPLSQLYDVLDVVFDLEASPDEFLGAFFSA